MAEADWQFTLPVDFANLYLLELFGWTKESSYELVYFSRSDCRQQAVGSSNPLQKYATQILYRHNGLEIEATALSYFDQGIVQAMWWRSDKKSHLTGNALRINGRWRVAQKGEEIIYLPEKTKTVNGILTICELGIYFSRIIQFEEIITASLKIVREY